MYRAGARTILAVGALPWCRAMLTTDLLDAVIIDVDPVASGSRLPFGLGFPTDRFQVTEMKIIDDATRLILRRGARGAFRISV
jgi:hypothetical protein